MNAAQHVARVSASYYRELTKADIDSILENVIMGAAVQGSYSINFELTDRLSEYKEYVEGWLLKRGFSVSFRYGEFYIDWGEYRAID